MIYYYFLQNQMFDNKLVNKVVISVVLLLVL
jgi:hypothetical protein